MDDLRLLKTIDDCQSQAGSETLHLSLPGMHRARFPRCQVLTGHTAHARLPRGTAVRNAAIHAAAAV